MKESRAPLSIAIVLLVVPLLYVGSYLALVRRDGVIHDPPLQLAGGLVAPSHHIEFYRLDWDFLATIYWPLEQLDRKLVPGLWFDWSTYPGLTAPPFYDPTA
jgi:hypothetical protein